MSNSIVNVAANPVASRAKHTRNAVIGFVAVIYAVAALSASRAQAEQPVQVTHSVLPEIVVTGYRLAQPASSGALPEVIVWGTREAVAPTAVLEEVVVWGARESADARGGYIAKVRSWLQSFAAKVSG